VSKCFSCCLFCRCLLCRSPCPLQAILAYLDRHRLAESKSRATRHWAGFNGTAGGHKRCMYLHEPSESSLCQTRLAAYLPVFGGKPVTPLAQMFLKKTPSRSIGLRKLPPGTEREKTPPGEAAQKTALGRQTRKPLAGRRTTNLLADGSSETRTWAATRRDLNNIRTTPVHTRSPQSLDRTSGGLRSLLLSLLSPSSLRPNSFSARRLPFTSDPVTGVRPSVFGALSPARGASATWNRSRSSSSILDSPSRTSPLSSAA
jgi:hypothetical protein